MQKYYIWILLIPVVSIIAVSANAQTRNVSGNGAGNQGTYDQCRSYVETNVRAGASKQTRSARLKIANAREVIGDFRRFRAELISDNTTWYGVNIASRWTLNIGAVAKATETSTNLLLNLLQLSPVKTVSKTAGALKTGKDLVVIFARNWGSRRDLFQTLAIYGAQKGGEKLLDKRFSDGAGAAAGATIELTTDTAEMANMARAHNAAKSELLKQLARFDREISRWERAAQSSLAALDAVETRVEREVSKRCAHLRSEPTAPQLPQARGPSSNYGIAVTPHWQQNGNSWSGAKTGFNNFNSVNTKNWCSSGRQLMNQARNTFNRVDSKFRQPYQAQFDNAVKMFEQACAR